MLRLLAELGNGGALAVAPLERALNSKEPTARRFISLTTINIRLSQNTLNLTWTTTVLRIIIIIIISVIQLIRNINRTLRRFVHI